MNILLHFKKHSKLLLMLLFVCSVSSAIAQTNDWFKGNWYGVKTFSNARVGVKVLVRIEVDSVYNDHFSGRLIYMYPKDTIARMIRTFNGDIHDKFASIKKGGDVYFLDPRSKSFWSNCTQCEETGMFSLNDNSLVFKIITTGCGDSCNAETVFSRGMNIYDDVAKAEIQKKFGQNQEQADIASGVSKRTIENKKLRNKILIDSGKSNHVATTALTTKQANNSKAVATTNVSIPMKADSLKTNSKTDSLNATANINPKQRNNKVLVAKQSAIDSNNNTASATAVNKKILKTNLKTDSLHVTANINSKQKNNKVLVAKQSTIDSINNTAGATAVGKKILKTNSKADSLNATANINSKQKNNKVLVAKQSTIDSINNTAGATAVNKKILKTNLKTDSLNATANISSKQRNKTTVVKQNFADSNQNIKSIAVRNTKLPIVSSSNQNNMVTKIDDSIKNRQPLSNSDIAANLPLLPAETFVLADTSNVFISRTDSVAMAKLHRETDLVNKFEVSDPHIQVELFDNGVIDSDAVTVYYNGRILFSNAALTYKPIAFVIDASGANKHHEFVLIAENEGLIPPNTALLRITAGQQQYKLFVSTTLSKNAKIAIDYTGY